MSGIHFELMCMTMVKWLFIHFNLLNWNIVHWTLVVKLNDAFQIICDIPTLYYV